MNIGERLYYIVAEGSTWQISFKIFTDPYLAAGSWIYSKQYINSMVCTFVYTGRPSFSRGFQLEIHWVLWDRFSQKTLCFLHLPIDFYISSILLRFTIKVSFFQSFPRRFSIISAFCMVNGKKKKQMENIVLKICIKGKNIKER